MIVGRGTWGWEWLEEVELEHEVASTRYRRLPPPLQGLKFHGLHSVRLCRQLYFLFLLTDDFTSASDAGEMLMPQVRQPFSWK